MYGRNKQIVKEGLDYSAARCHGVLPTYLMSLLVEYHFTNDNNDLCNPLAGRLSDSPD